MTRYFDEALQAAGLRATQFVMLVTLHADPGVGMPALGETLALDRSAVTRRLQPLVRAGLVRIQGSKAGGPSRVLLTAKGVRQLESAVPLWQVAQARVVAELGEQRWADILEGMAGMRRAVGCP